MVKFRDLFQFKKIEIDYIFKNVACKKKLEWGVILFAPRPVTRDYSKACLMVSRKFGKAHKRNLVRRQIKNLFFQNGYSKINYDVLFLLNRPVVTNFSQLQNDCEKLFRPSMPVS